MKLDNSTFAFNFTIAGSAGNPNWSTALGQGVGHKINPGDDIVDVLKGVSYKGVPLASVQVPLKKGAHVYNGADVESGVVSAAKFDDVYLNGSKVPRCSFVLLVVRDTDGAHKGRLKLKYSPKIEVLDDQGNVIFSNEDGLEKMRQALSLRPTACWFVYDLKVVAQDQLHLAACVADPRNPVSYTSTKDIHDKWDALISQGRQKLAYGKNDFLAEVFVQQSEYDCLVGLISAKKNIVLQGAPGVGKTFAAKRLCWSMIGEQGDSHISFVQFHQSYSYEDFVLGFKPNAAGGFSVVTGAFYNACKAALARPSEKFFVVIDEVNRGNISRIFGELLMLIESDKRGSLASHKYSVKLPCADSIEDEWDKAYASDFFVPENLYIVGMMNTADRSLAMIDYALRRRFAFYEMVPAFGSQGFGKIKPNNAIAGKYAGFIGKIQNLNDELAKEFGRGFCIGHSYFSRQGLTKAELENIVNFEIYPTLQEYWFDDDSTPKKADTWKASLIGALA